MVKRGSQLIKPKTCTYKMHKDKPCGRILYDKKFCIFHSRNIKGKKALYKKIFKKELEM
jgi:hypothetical protein